MTALPDRVAQVVLDCFSALPQKCKPRTFPDGRREWTPLSAVIVVRGEQQSIVECVALATGTKCLPSNIIPQCQGAVLHDCHAEVLALRGFNRWLLQEIRHQLTDSHYRSQYVERQATPDSTLHDRPFRLRPDLSLHFFTTEAPCGDASMELLMASKSPDEAAPWDTNGLEEDDRDAVLLGRGHFSILGAVRRKPARADAQPSLSKSCSDKLAAKQVTSLLAFPADMLVERTSNTFLSTVIMPAEQYSEPGYDRAFGPSGRMRDLAAEGAVFFKTDTLSPQSFKYEFAKATDQTTPIKASNISTLWIRSNSGSTDPTLEILLNGVKQGYKQFDVAIRKQSVVCRNQMCRLGGQIHESLGRETVPVSDKLYRELKNNVLRTPQRQRKSAVRRALGRWTPNEGDDDWYPN